MVTTSELVHVLRADLERRIDDLARDERVAAEPWGELVRSTRDSLSTIERASANSVIRFKEGTPYPEEGERTLVYLARLNARPVEIFVRTVTYAQRFRHESWYAAAVRQHDALIEGLELAALAGVKGLNAAFYHNTPLEAYVDTRYRAYIEAADRIRTDPQDSMRTLAREALARIETRSERTENA